MAEITEEALAGEWFYLEEEEPFDATTTRYLVLGDGDVRWSDEIASAGTYVIHGDQVAITFVRVGVMDGSMVLGSDKAAFDETTPTLQSNATYHFDELDEPVESYGTLVRRTSDYATTAEIAKRLG